ncbi:MAG: PKD domain-containing protein [Flavobacteriia bacterium]|jgi:PKD repeat protein
MVKIYKRLKLKTTFLLLVLMGITRFYFGQCNNGPNANFNFSGGNNQCANLPKTFTNTSTGTGLTFQWNFGNTASGVNNTSTNLNPIHEFISNGGATETFDVQLVATDVNGCTDTIVKTVTVRQTPGANLIDPNNGFRNCDGNAFNMNVFDITPTLPPDVTNYTIQWGDGSANFSANSFPGGGVSHTYGTVEVFNMIYIVDGANGCSDSLTLSVGNITNPSIGAANPGGTTGCAPLSICFPLNNFGANHPTTIYLVDYGDGTPVDTLPHPPPNQLCHSYTTPSCGVGGGSYTFTITAVNFCDVSVASINPIRVFIAPVPSFTTPSPVCAGVPTVMTNTSAPGFNNTCSTFTNVNWDFGDGTSVSMTNLGVVSHTYNNPGTYDVILSTGNSCGTATATQQVCVEAAPVPDFTVTPSTGCIPLEVETNDLSSMGQVCSVTRSWSTTFDNTTCSPFSGTRNFINGTNASSLEPEFVFTDPGIYSIVLTMSNSCGNITHTEQIIAQGPPEISINPVSSICGGQSVSPTAVVNDCQESINSYLWNFAGASTVSSNQQSPGTITYPNNGAFTITLTATNSCGSDVATTGLTVNSVPPALNPITATPLCAGYDAEFFSDPVANATYNWSGPNGFTSNQQNPIITNVSAANAGVYTVFASFGSCSGASQTVNLAVLPITVVNAGNDITNCIDDTPFTIVSATPAGGVWSGPGVTALGLFDPSLAGSGTHTLTYTYTDPGTLCVYSDDILATVNSLPTVDAGIDLSLCNQPIANTLTPVTPLNGVWSGPGVTDPAGEFTPSTNGTFEVLYSFTNGNGCFNQDTIQVTVIDPTNADAGPDSTICENGNNVQLTGLPLGGTWSGVGITATGDFDPTVAGTFTMTYSFGSGTCQTDDVMDFIINPAPTVDAGNDFTICLDGGTVDLSTSPNLLGGTWSGNGITNPSGIFDPMVAGNGAHVLTYTYTDPITNCSNTDVLTANVNPLPIVNAGNDTTLCNQPLGVQLPSSPAGGVWTGLNVDASGVFTPNGIGVFELVYGFNLSGCDASDTVLITIVDPSQADAGLDLEMCFSNTQTQLTGLPLGGTWTGTGIAGNGNYTPNVPGTYEMVYSFGGGNCLTRDTMNLIVHDLPVIDAGLDRTFCESDFAVNFFATPAGGAWSGTGIVDVNFGTFDPSAALNDGVAYPMTYTFTDANSCTNSDFLLATVNPLPTVLFNYNPIVCLGVAENFTNNTILGDQYAWDFDDNTPIDNAVNPIHTYNSTGFFDINLVATTIFGCVDSLSQTIEVREPPVADFTVLPDSACGPLIANFNNLSSGLGVLTYAWDFGNGQVSVAQNPAAQTYIAGIIADTSYYITLGVTNECGTVIKTDTVKVMPNPTAIFGPQFDVGCSPFTASFADISVGLPDNYSWDFGNGVTSNISDSLFTQVFVIGLEDTTYTIRLIVSNECGVDTAFHDIHILPTSVNSFFNTNITEGCAPLTVDFTSVSAGATQFNWDFGDGNVSSQSSFTNVFTQAGTYTVRLIVNDDCSRDTSFATITVHPQPDIDFSFTPNSACAGLPFNFTNLSTNVSNLTWDFDDGTNSFFSNPTHIFQNSGTYNVTLTGTSTLFACQASITHPVTVVVSPTASFTIPPAARCVPATIGFTNTSSNFNFINWDFGDGNVSSLSSPSHQYTSPGNYTVKLVVENNVGCRDSITQIVQVFPVPEANFDVLSVDSCHLPSLVTVGNTSVGSTSYLWNFGNGLTSVLTNPSVFYDVPSTYFIKLVATNQYGCRDSLIKDVTIFQPPVANFVISNQIMCQGESFTGNSLSINADSTRWFMGDGNVLSGSAINYEYENSGDFFVTVVAYGDGGCSDTMFATVPITILVTPIANFDYVNTIEDDLINGTIDFINLSSNANSYLWFLDTDTTSTQVNPRYQFDHFGNEYVTLIAYNINGCTDTIIKLITIDYYNGLFVGNAMYPAHPDFEVSHFLPKGVGLQSYHLMIYDDWGNLIWETTALDTYGRPTEGWDGTYKGEPVQQDAYVWKIDATYMTSEVWEGKQYPDGRIKKAGTVTVIR